MCGIAGVIDRRSGVETSIEMLKSMSDVMYHRGPDDEGQWLSDDRLCGLAFRRLSIIDLSSAGHQPMLSPDERFVIVFNGEIYNHKLIREELCARGYRYRSQSDTETILYGYREFGAEILSKMVGMWGLAIWDNEKKELFCARDRIGIKPLYYYFKNDILIFASEIKAILKHPAVQAELNPDELPNYLCFSISSECETLFKNIHKLRAGHFLRLDAQGDATVKRYWSPVSNDSVDTKLSREEVKVEIMRLLRQAVKDRMMSDVPFGVFLSGGIDSSVNVALMAELMDRPVDTFTVGFKELEKYNELEQARLVSRSFGTNQHEILIDHNDAFGELENLAWQEDEPNGDPVCIPLFFLSKLTRECGTTVLQVGEGSDEQFIGYPWMLREWKFYNGYWKWFNRFPRGIRTLSHKLLSPLFKTKAQYLALDYMRRSAEGDELYWGGGVDMTPTHMHIIAGPELRSTLTSAPALPRRLHTEFRNAKPNGDYLQEIEYYELAHRLPELLLMRVDKMCMAHSLEARVPFLDHRLVEFTMTIPASHKVSDSYSTKLLLKEAVQDLLPREIVYRKKQGFAAPVSEWFKSYWFKEARDLILHSPLVDQGFFDRNGLDHLLNLHRSGKANFGKSLYSLMNLTLWYNKFLR